MTKKIILAVLILIAEIGLGYYSLFVKGSLFWKFLFFILSAFIVCMIVINGVSYILPAEDKYHHPEEDL